MISHDGPTVAQPTRIAFSSKNGLAVLVSATITKDGKFANMIRSTTKNPHGTPYVSPKTRGEATESFTRESTKGHVVLELRRTRPGQAARP